MVDSISTPCLYYITHIDNLVSILNHGILSHMEVENQNITKATISDPGIISRRNNRCLGDKNLLDYANLFFQPRNPMLYRVLKEIKEAGQAIGNIVILQVSSELLKRDDIYLSDSVAARNDAKMQPNNACLLNEIRKHINPIDWYGDPSVGQKLQAECLVPKQVDPDLIKCIWVADSSLVPYVRQKLSRRCWHSLDVLADDRMFFNMYREYPLWRAGKLAVSEGDMFTSRSQTITIPVNTKGVMGKGVAYVAKKDHPSVLKFYQQLCFNNQLLLGKPVLFPLPSLVAAEHANNKIRNLLLFPTKEHWRSKSRLKDILNGLDHLLKNCKDWGITSLGLPALGCGFGRLLWEDARYEILPKLQAIALAFPVTIYLSDPSHVAVEKNSNEYEAFLQFMQQSM